MIVVPHPLERRIEARLLLARSLDRGRGGNGGSIQILEVPWLRLIADRAFVAPLNNRRRSASSTGIDGEALLMAFIQIGEAYCYKVSKATYLVVKLAHCFLGK